MDIYDYAIQMEKDGETYYRELGRKSKAEGLQFIFTILADEEVTEETGDSFSDRCPDLNLSTFGK